MKTGKQTEGYSAMKTGKQAEGNSAMKTDMGTTASNPLSVHKMKPY